MRLIDADALMKWANDHYDFEVYTVGYISNLIKDMPTVDAEPIRHGEWIEYPIADGMNQCSECGVLRLGCSNYCPNCGAKMERKEE